MSQAGLSHQEEEQHKSLIGTTCMVDLLALCIGILLGIWHSRTDRHMVLKCHVRLTSEVLTMQQTEAMMLQLVSTRATRTSSLSSSAPWGDQLTHLHFLIRANTHIRLHRCSSCITCHGLLQRQKQKCNLTWHTSLSQIVDLAGHTDHGIGHMQPLLCLMSLHSLAKGLKATSLVVKVCSTHIPTELMTAVIAAPIS